MLDEDQIEGKTAAFDVVSSEFSFNHSIELEGVSTSLGKSDVEINLFGAVLRLRL